MFAFTPSSSKVTGARGHGARSRRAGQRCISEVRGDNRRGKKKNLWSEGGRVWARDLGARPLQYLHNGCIRINVDSLSTSRNAARVASEHVLAWRNERAKRYSPHGSSRASMGYGMKLLKRNLRSPSWREDLDPRRPSHTRRLLPLPISRSSALFAPLSMRARIQTPSSTPSHVHGAVDNAETKAGEQHICQAQYKDTVDWEAFSSPAGATRRRNTTYDYHR